MKYKIQEEIGNHFLDHAIKLVQEGKTFVFVLDNIDWDVKVHDRERPWERGWMPARRLSRMLNQRPFGLSRVSLQYFCVICDFSVKTLNHKV